MPAASRFDHTTILALPGLRPLTYRRHSGEAPTCNINNTALIQINDDVEIGELDDTWSNAFAGWNLIASIGSYVSLRLRTQGAGRLKSLGRRRVTLEWCRASNGGSDTGWAGKRPQDDPPGAVSFYSTGVCGKSHSTNPRGRVRLST